MAKVIYPPEILKEAWTETIRKILIVKNPDLSLGDLNRYAEKSWEVLLNTGSIQKGLSSVAAGHISEVPKDLREKLRTYLNVSCGKN